MKKQSDKEPNEVDERRIAYLDKNITTIEKELEISK